MTVKNFINFFPAMQSLRKNVAKERRLIHFDRRASQKIFYNLKNFKFQEKLSRIMKIEGTCVTVHVKTYLRVQRTTS